MCRERIKVPGDPRQALCARLGRRAKTRTGAIDGGCEVVCSLDRNAAATEGRRFDAGPHCIVASLVILSLLGCLLACKPLTFGQAQVGLCLAVNEEEKSEEKASLLDAAMGLDYVTRGGC